MRNLWVQTEDAFARWHADVTGLLAKPEVLVELACAIYDAGVEYDVLLPLKAPKLGFERGRSPDITTLARRRWKEQRTVGLFKAMSSAHVEAMVAWFDRDHQIIEQMTHDLSEVLTALEPVPGAIYRHCREPGPPPVELTGWAFDYPDRHTPVQKPLGRVTFGCALHSDIWFPFVLGFAHPQRDLKRWFDNRELATRHTPRLNAFIERCATLVTDVGARWYVEPAESNRLAAAWVHERGIRLDGPVPDLMPETALEAVWEAVDLD
jgi:hypothetical protein